MGEVGDAVYQGGYLGEEDEAVVSYTGVTGHDEDGLEEGVYGLDEWVEGAEEGLD